ncbi:hypothetical protein Tco_0336047 [Tanacetum coccineum]
MGSRKKNGSKKKKKKNRNSSKKKKKNIVPSQNHLVTRFPQLRLNKKVKGSNSDQLDKDFLKMDVAQLHDPAYPLGGLPLHAKIRIKEAIALMEDLEKNPGDCSLRMELGFAQAQIDRITPYLKSRGHVPRDWDL